MKDNTIYNHMLFAIVNYEKSDVLDDFRMGMLSTQFNSRNFLPLIRQIQMSYIIKVIT